MNNSDYNYNYNYSNVSAGAGCSNGGTAQEFQGYGLSIIRIRYLVVRMFVLWCWLFYVYSNRGMSKQYPLTVFLESPNNSKPCKATLSKTLNLKSEQHCTRLVYPWLCHAKRNKQQLHYAMLFHAVADCWVGPGQTRPDQTRQDTTIVWVVLSNENTQTWNNNTTNNQQKTRPVLLLLLLLSLSRSLLLLLLWWLTRLVLVLLLLLL